jgi:hypothetical protein
VNAVVGENRPLHSSAQREAMMSVIAIYRQLCPDDSF